MSILDFMNQHPLITAVCAECMHKADLHSDKGCGSSWQLMRCTCRVTREALLSDGKEST